MKQLIDYADILIEAPCYLGYLCMADKFCKKYLGASKRKELMFIVFSFGGHLTLNIANIRYTGPYILYAILYNILFMGLVLLLFGSGWEKKILAASLLMTAVRLAGNFCSSFLSCLILFFRYTVQKIPEPFLSGWESGLIVCAYYCLTIYAVYWMWGCLAPVFDGKPGKWYAALAIPLLMLITVFDVTAWGACHGIMVRSGGNMGLYYDQIFSHAEFVFLTLFSMAAVGFYVFGMQRIYAEQEKNNRYHSQIAVYKMLAEQYRQSEGLRHDMKNHIIALSALSRNKEWKKLDSYLKNMESSGMESGGDMTGSSAVDALLYQKRKRAREVGIRWECDVQVPKEGNMDEFDLCILFGNILDNAIEACERLRCNEDRLIHIQARTVKKCFLLEVKNSMDRTEKYTEGFTNKDNPQEHGIGLLNVSDVMNKYDGVMNTEAEKGIFVISILMPLKCRM
ncbi:sensor histidine kinase [Parablautia muri]|uniref:ATP-binding protein n=1 Tax=Parablautia muri TaxID=2320879 RepID=A0A9X5BFZ9_9FIRM|nr:GHKL domain-containing protein [Parablautia muri]NBJ93014.1 ATP-binding protein [Parablautia muri]